MPPERVVDGAWRLPLPSRTLPPFDHTNSYLVQSGRRGVLVDVGSDDPQVLAGLEATLSVLGVTELTALLLTHTHPDHAVGAAAVQAAFGVPVYAHPLEPSIELTTQPLGDGDTVRVGDTTLRAHHTPGHSPGHLSFSLPARAVLVGDLLTARGSTWVGLPGGDVADYLASLDLLARLDAAVLGPGHGPVVREPKGRLAEVRAHRLAREAEVVAALRAPLDLTALRRAVYPDVPEGSAALTEGALRAHLVKLVREGRVAQMADRRYRTLDVVM